MGAEVTLFDYGALAAEVATELRGTAERVRARFKRATSDIIENGRDLLKVKDRLKHGEFTAWVESELGMSARNAQTMMRAAEVAAEESENFSLLQPTVALKLAAPSVPAEVRTAFVERAVAGERIPVAAVDNEMRRIRDEREDAERQAKLDARTPAAKAAERRRREKEAADRLEVTARWEASERAQKDRAKEIALILRGRLTASEWSEIRDKISGGGAPYIGMLVDSMGAARYLDVDHEEYLPPAHRVYADVDTAHLVAENERLNELVEGYHANIERRAALYNEDLPAALAAYDALTADERLQFHEQRPDPTAPFEPPASLRVKIPQLPA